MKLLAMHPEFIGPLWVYQSVYNRVTKLRSNEQIRSLQFLARRTS